MSLYCFLYPLRFDTNISLRSRSRAVLQEPLDKCDVVAIVLVNLCRIPLAETVSADPLIPEIITNYLQLLLDCPLCNGENAVIGTDAVPQTVILNILRYHKRHGKNAVLSCLLLYDFQTVAVAIPHNVAGTQFYNITYAKPQVSFQHQSRGDTLIGTAAAEALLHCLDYLFILLRSESLCFLIHSTLQE